MRGFFGLLSINLSGRVVSVLVFAWLARILESEHLAYVGLIPALSGLVLAAFGFGVGTLLERDVPRLLVSDPARADALQRSGFLVASLSIVIMVLVFWVFVDAWTGLFLADYTFEAGSIRWIALPMAAYMFNEINAWMMIIRRETKAFGILKIYGDIAAKLAVVGLYLWRPSETSVFLGLALGHFPFLVVALWLQRGWLFKAPLFNPLKLIWESRVFYAEANFTALRDRGDSVLVSSVLGPIAMANYYVAKSVAAQLLVFYSPVTSLIVPVFSSRLGQGKQELALVFRKVWSIAPPLFIWLASSIAAISPVVLALIAGPEYAHNWQTAMILCFVSAAMATHALGTRILLVMGSSHERFRIVVIHAALLGGLIFLFRDSAGPAGIALAWLIAAVVTIFVIKLRASHMAFDWPVTTALLRALACCVPVPVITLYGLGYGAVPDWLFVTVAGGLSCLSLLALLILQDAFEAQQMVTRLPRMLVPAYSTIRRLAKRAPT